MVERSNENNQDGDKELNGDLDHERRCLKVEEVSEDVRMQAVRALSSMRAGGDFFLTNEQLEEALAVKDLTLEESGPNPITLLLGKLSEELSAKFGGFPELRRSSPIVTVSQNFDDLLFPDDSISRSPIYTRYIDQKNLLRTHTSSMVPSILAEKPDVDDRILVCPGICFRRDVVDKTHTGTPHQVDIWRIKRGGEKMGREDLVELIETILKIAFPGVQYRLNEVVHPYTLNGVEVEVFYRDKWLEVLEAGLAHPEVLRNAGLDPEIYSGLASGFGLDRLAMLAKNIEDIRILRSKDPRIVAQMQNLDPYEEVSKMPPMKRDISVVVDNSLTIEDVTEKIRVVIGQDKIDLIEEISVLDDTSYEDLPPIACQRLGAKEGQKNLLIRIVIRAIDRTLVKDEADIIRDEAYLAVHDSDVKMLIRN